MKISQPRKVIDPYEWLPGYGESGVTIVSDGLQLVVTVRYDRQDSPSGQICTVERDLRFEFAASVVRQPFPGGFVFEVAGDTKDLKLGALTEFQSSEFVDRYLSARLAVTSHRPVQMRHFAIQFLSENLDVHVIATGVILSDERPAATAAVKPSCDLCGC